MVILVLFSVHADRLVFHDKTDIPARLDIAQEMLYPLVFLQIPGKPQLFHFRIPEKHGYIIHPPDVFHQHLQRLVVKNVLPVFPPRVFPRVDFPHAQVPVFLARLSPVLPAATRLPSPFSSYRTLPFANVVTTSRSPA